MPPACAPAGADDLVVALAVASLGHRVSLGVLVEQAGLGLGRGERGDRTPDVGVARLLEGHAEHAPAVGAADQEQTSRRCLRLRSRMWGFSTT